MRNPKFKRHLQGLVADVVKITSSYFQVFLMLKKKKKRWESNNTCSWEDKKVGLSGKEGM